MKRSEFRRARALLFSLFIVLVVTSCGGGAQAKAEDSFKTLRAAMNSLDYTAFAKYVVYQGEDKARTWKDVCDFNAPSDQESVGRMFTELAAALNGSTGEPRVLGYESETESEGTFHILRLAVPKSAGDEQLILAFLDIRNVMALADIDTSM